MMRGVFTVSVTVIPVTSAPLVCDGRSFTVAVLVMVAHGAVLEMICS